MPAASASSPISRAASRTSIVAQGLQILLNLDHRGAVGADPLVGDGAGILIQIPDALLRDWAGEARRRPAAAGRLRRGHVLPAAGRAGARLRDQAVRALHRQVEGQTLLGWRDVPTDTDGPRQGRARRDAGDPPGHHRPRARTSTTRTRSSASCWPSASRRRTRWPSSAKKHEPARPDRSSTCRRFSTRTVVYKGLLLAHQVGSFYEDLRDPLTRVGAGAGAPALLDQHLPVLEAGAPLSLHRPQRRDQHRARQRQLDERAPPHAWNPTCSAPTSTRCGR